MRVLTSTVVLLLAAIHATSAQTAYELCAGCKMVNGAGYNSHMTDCDKFVHCHYGPDGALIGEVQQCSFSTYWNPNLLTCTSAEDTFCPNDKCKGLPDGTIIDAEGNCRGYWECHNQKAHAKCCARGQNWNNTLLACMNNDDEDQCTDKCFNEEDEVPCDMEAVPGKPNFFRQQVPGFFWVTMPCAPGTVFVQSMCSCAEASSIAAYQATCQRELYLPFTTNHQDESGKRQYVGNENVVVANGMAHFNGDNSRLIIPRFTNIQGVHTVVIRVRYVSDHVNAPEEHAIVSNSDCGNTPSILISEDKDNVILGVGTQFNALNILKLKQPDVPANETMSVKEVVYEFDKGMLRGSNGADSGSVSTPGALRNVQCGLHIGDADNMAPFQGLIDEVEVFLCNPK